MATCVVLATPRTEPIFMSHDPHALYIPKWPHAGTENAHLSATMR